MKEIYRPLDNEDIALIKAAMKPSLIIPFLGFFFFYLIFLAVCVSNNWDIYSSWHYIMVLDVIISIMLYYAMSAKHRSDIQNGEKEGSIIPTEEKRIHTFQERYGSLLTYKKKTKKIHLIVLEKVTYPIQSEEYDKLETGDLAVIYYTPKSKLLLSIKKWED